MKGIGLDSLEIYRMEKALKRYGQRLADKIFTREEWAYCQGRSQPAASLAVRFAAKEAVVKALGADWRYLRWKEIEIVSNKGKPFIELHGRTARASETKGITCWHVSLTHDRERAMAVAVAE